jgi:hypothetical protein
MCDYDDQLIAMGMKQFTPYCEEISSTGTIKSSVENMVNSDRTPQFWKTSSDFLENWTVYLIFLTRTRTIS